MFQVLKKYEEELKYKESLWKSELKQIKFNEYYKYQGEELNK